MTRHLVYRTMRPGEEGMVCRLVRRVFDACVAPDFAEQGVREFLRFAEPEAMRARMQAGGFVLIAMDADRPSGMLEFVPPGHIAMMFVRERGQGIGRALLARVAERARAADPPMSVLTVHAAGPAVPIYRKLGFRPVGAVTTRNGITYTPMELSL